MNEARQNGLINYFLPEEEPTEADKDFIDFYSQFNIMLMPVAFVISYARNKSWKWALIHTALAAPYVAYVSVDWIAREEARELLDLSKKAQ